MRAKVIEFFKDSKENAHRAWKAICANEGKFTDRLDMAKENAKSAIVRYDNEQAAIRRKEQARLQAIADEQARKEKERLEKQAEKLKTPERKEALLEQAAQVTAAVVELSPDKSETKGRTTRWQWRCKDFTAVPDSYKMLNEKMLNGIATSTKGALEVPGIEFYPEYSVTIK
jgi:hypothetical protein